MDTCCRNHNLRKKLEVQTKLVEVNDSVCSIINEQNKESDGVCRELPSLTQSEQDRVSVSGLSTSHFSITSLTWVTRRCLTIGFSVSVFSRGIKS